MQYRKFGKLDWNTSILGFGAMRLPVRPDKEIDEQKAVGMIHRAIEGGVNYIDSAYVYHGGQSETLVGKALAGGWRSKVRIATKCPIWLLANGADFDRILGEQLQRLATDHIDFYMMHGIGTWGWGRIRELGLLERAEAARRDGRIGHIGFSFHDKLSVFESIVDGYDWEFCQIQYNYMDTDNQAGDRGLRYAADKGLPIIVMEPILGGRLANPPPAIRRVFDEFPVKRNPSAWALRWVWDHPEVTTVLSGMSTMEQVEDNLRSAEEDGSPNVMTKEEQEVIARVRALFNERTVIPCTKCDYCAPCPQGVEISRLFELYNGGKMFHDLEGSRFVYKTFVDEKARADKCIACGECEAKCPQSIPIGEWMPKVHAVLGGGQPYPNDG